MPLPVLHKRFAQAAVKMVTAPTGPVAALSERPVGSNSTAGGHWCTSRSPDVSLRGAKRRGNLAEPDRTTGKSSAKSQLPSRDCHVGLRPPRNDKSGPQCHFNDSLYWLQVRSREGHVPPLQRAAEVLRILHSSFFSLPYSFTSVPLPYKPALTRPAPACTLFPHGRSGGRGRRPRRA